jgi:murein DD-endopeptidase MepM/ murein hydrolase activator NlpD
MAISLIYPVNGPVTQNFGENPDLYKKWGYPGHNGVDFGIPNGTPVLAAAKGTIDKVSFEDGGYGNYVKIKHMDGSTVFYTYYAHLMQASVAAGQNVEASAVVGYSNNTGASTGPHLHFGLRKADTSDAYKGYMDALPYLKGQVISGGDMPGAVALPDMKFEVITAELNVRSGPGINFSIVDKLKKGKVVTTKRLYSEGAWIEIEPGKWCAVTFSGVQNMKVK